MAKTLAVLVAVLMMLSFSGAGLAAQGQTTVGTTGTTHQVEKTTEHGLMSYTGQTASVDQKGQMVVIKGKEGDKTFDVSRAVMKGMPEINQFVSVNYREANGRMAASSLRLTPQKVSRNVKTLSEKHTS